MELDDDVSLDQPPTLTFDPRDESKKVAALLEELKPSSSDPGRGYDEKDKKDDEDDDSDGEQMSAQVNQVLSRALDEAELDRSLPSQQADQDAAQHTPPSPTAIPQVPPSDPNDPFSLPTVPSQLLDPAPTAPTEEPPTFESSIAARMAALKGVSYSTDADTFGLPQAPSFNPDSRSESATPRYAGKLSGGYTDEDQKTWCVVCLEDATVRCIGCDGGDVYCGRCWREMHVGPRAGYDERGHRWVRFERGK